MSTNTITRMLAVFLWTGWASGCRPAPQPPAAPVASTTATETTAVDPDSSEAWLSSRLKETADPAAKAPTNVAVKPVPMVVQVVATHPHDPQAFVQGLEMVDGVLYESTGLSGASSVRRLDLPTGRIIHSTSLPDNMFAEGLTMVHDEIYQLTLSEQVALVYDRATMKQVRQIPYEGESWGICFDGTRIVTSNGTDTLLFRDPKTFREIGRLRITIEGRTFWVGGINELECVGDEIYGNVWPTQFIARIDRKTGAVTAVIDTSALPVVQARDYGLGVMNGLVMNGIAYRSETDTFLLGRKMWPHIYEVKLVPSPE